MKQHNLTKQLPLHFLTKTNFLKGLFFSLMEKYTNPQYQKRVFSYQNHKPLKVYKEKLDNINQSLVAIFKLNKKKLLVKKLSYKFHNLSYEHLLNEISMLIILNRSNRAKVKNNTISFPRIYKIVRKEHEITFAREYIEGKQLSRYSPGIKIKTIISCIDIFTKLTSQINVNEIKKLPKRSSLEISVTLPLYFIKALAKFPNNFANLISIFKEYYFNLTISTIFRPTYVLSHRDLHSNNIILNKMSTYIIDPEICTLAEELTDLSIVSRIYMRELGAKKINELLSYYLISSNDWRIFCRLTIFYTVQILATQKKQSLEYKEGLDYIDYLVEVFLPQFNINLLHYGN